MRPARGRDCPWPQWSSVSSSSAPLHRSTPSVVCDRCRKQATPLSRPRIVFLYTPCDAVIPSLPASLHSPLHETEETIMVDPRARRTLHVARQCLASPP